MRSALIKRWPESKVHLFGSTANQLSICNNNDIDVCLELPDLPSDAVRPDSYIWLPVYGLDLYLIVCICKSISWKPYLLSRWWCF